METETLSILDSRFDATAPLRKGYFTNDAEMVKDYRGFNMNEVPSKAPYSIVPITKKDTDKVVHFLRKFFFRDEPLNVAVGLLDEPHTTCVELEEYSLNSIPDGLSLAAVSPSGYFLGICLNGISTREREELDNSAEDIKNCTNPKFKKILRLLTTLKKHSDVFGHFPTAQRILDIVILSVDESYRGQGICKALIEKTKEIANENDISLIRVDCSSHYSAKAVSHLGFHSIYSLSYADYTDSEGNQIFKTKAPHTCATTYVLPLSL